MEQNFDGLNLQPNFPSSATLKLAKYIFGVEKPFTCRQIYDYHVKYYGNEVRSRRRIATSFAQLIQRGYFIKHDMLSPDGLNLYKVADPKNKMANSKNKKKSILSYRHVFKLINDNFKNQEFSINSVIDKMHRKKDVRYQFKTMIKRGLIEFTKRDGCEKLYKIVDKSCDSEPKEQEIMIDVKEPDIMKAEKDQEIVIEKTVDNPDTEENILDRETLRNLNIPFDLIGEAIVNKIKTLNQKIDDLEMNELGYKRRLDEVQKVIQSQSRIIESLNAKVTQLNREAPKSKKNTIANLGEIARISTLRNNAR